MTRHTVFLPVGRSYFPMALLITDPPPNSHNIPADHLWQTNVGNSCSNPWEKSSLKNVVSVLNTSIINQKFPISSKIGTLNEQNLNLQLSLLSVLYFVLYLNNFFFFCYISLQAVWLCSGPYYHDYSSIWTEPGFRFSYNSNQSTLCTSFRDWCLFWREGVQILCKTLLSQVSNAVSLCWV